MISVSHRTYLYKVLASVICYSSGEIDTTSGYDYLCLKNKSTNEKKLVMLKLFTTKDTNRQPAAALTVQAAIPRRLSSAERWLHELFLLNETCFIL